ncbi:MAG: hypothetical protein HKN51_13185 [Saprospiraceae bacterium]|nr:hypothetical protein [Saprospiraceae bacterium]
MDTDDIIECIKEDSKQRQTVIAYFYDDTSLKNNITRVVENILGNRNQFDYIFQLTITQFLKNVISTPNYDFSSDTKSHLQNLSRYISLALMRKQNKDVKNLREEFELIKDNINIDLDLLFESNGSIGQIEKSLFEEVADVKDNHHKTSGFWSKIF